jgi:hypothetical protein
MFRLFAPFRLFDLFRVPSGASDAPSVAVSDAGLVTVVCRTSAAPSVAVSDAGLATVSCS